MDLGRAISFPFDDDDWLVKIIIGSLIGWIPFIGQGYQVRVARNLMQGKKRPLPGSEELGQVVTDGVMAFIALLVYFLPVIFVGCLIFVSTAIFGNDPFGGLFCCLSSVCLFAGALVYIIPATALYWMGVIRYAESGNFSEFVQVGALWRDVLDNLDILVMLLIYLLVLLLIIGAVAAVAIITCVGPLVVVFYGQVVTGHLIGQAGIEIVHNR